MVKNKKITTSTLALLVVSVLLVMSVTIGATLAWFSSTDNDSDTITFANKLTIELTDNAGDGYFNIVTAGSVVPGSTVRPNASINVTASNTPMLLRAFVEVTIVGENADLEAITVAMMESIAVSLARTDSGWAYYNGHFYYIGNAADAATGFAYVMKTTEAGEATGAITGDAAALTGTPTTNATYVAAENRGITNATVNAATGATYLEKFTAASTGLQLASVYAPSAAKVDFLTESFKLAGSITDVVANGTITVNVVVEAVQDLFFFAGVNDGKYIIPALDVNITNLFGEAFTPVEP